MPIDLTALRLESLVALADTQLSALRLEALVTQENTSLSALRIEALLGSENTILSAMRLEILVSGDIFADDDPPFQGQAERRKPGLQGHTSGIRKGHGPLY